MYTQSITRNHRTAFFIAIDCSGSMSEQLRFRGRTASKAEAVASITNGLLFELIERARRNDGVRNYYDVAVLGYSGDDEVHSLLPDGGIALRELPVPIWVEPHAAGQTPMCEALRRIRDLAAAWCAEAAHAASFPPIVFNITDGEATDCDEEELRTVCDQIKSLGTADGKILLVNIHITAGEMPQTAFFPSEEEPRIPNRYAALLYDCSSVMPAVFDEAIRAVKGPGALPPFRGVSYNASADELVAMLNIGSISVKTE